jgi:hypothetical protein
MHIKTMAIHSDFKTPEDEDNAYEQWQLAQDTAAKRRKKEERFRRCPCCDAQYQ